MNVPPVAELAVIAYGLPATCAVAAAPAELSVALPTVSPFCNPVGVNSVPVNANVLPYVFAWFCAVTVSAAGFTVRFYLGTANVTSAVVAGTYEKTLAPGASLTITVKIGVLSDATIGAVKSERLSATSLKQPLTDVVLAKVTAR